MPKKAGILFVTVGAVLLLSALLLFFYSEYEEYHAGQEAERVLDGIQSVIAVQTESPVSAAEGEVETLPAEMPVAEIDGYECVGYISIPDLDLELPDDVVVENVHLSDSLMQLSYNIVRRQDNE